MVNQQHVKLARTLPPKLLRFFARYPPTALSSGIQSLPPGTLNSASSDVPSSEANANPGEADSQPIPSLPGNQNPFQKTRNEVTNVWRDPVYSLRWQAAFVKMARKHGVEELLPYTTKGTEVKIQKREEFGLRVKGTGVGQRVKGHWRERTLKGRLEGRRQAMIKMPEMINEWKMVWTRDTATDSRFADNLTEGTWSWNKEVAKVIDLSLRLIYSASYTHRYLPATSGRPVNLFGNQGRSSLA